MSAENVETVRAAFEAWNAGDMEALAALYDPDMVLRGPEAWPERGPFMGRDAVLRQFRQIRDPFRADEVVAVGDFVDAGDRVLVRMRWQASGHGPEIAMEWTLVYTLRRRRVILLEYFSDHAEALDVVGLRSSCPP